MPTPHNNANKGDFAKTVLMPGDPLRAKFIAETFLTEPKLVNNVRGVQGYTGTYKGVPVSVMASGMGIPSIGIYSYELYTQYDVENIIRVGSAGAMRADLELGSVVAGQGACTNSDFASQYELGGSYAPGLIIGTVVKVDTRQGESTRRVIVSPNDTTGALEEVLVVFGVGAVGEADGNEGGDAS